MAEERHTEHDQQPDLHGGQRRLAPAGDGQDGDREARDDHDYAAGEHGPQQPRGPRGGDRAGLAGAVAVPAGGAEADEGVRLQGEDAAEDQKQEGQITVGLGDQIRWMLL